LSIAIGEAQTGSWVLDSAQRKVIAGIVAATCFRRGARSAPFSDDPWDVRIGRIAKWAGVVRSAAEVGGWMLQPVAGRSPQRPVGMAELLSALYAIGEQGEIWTREFLTSQAWPPEQQIAEIEHTLTGPGTIEDLDLFFY
jgi:hypothetical protein